MCVKEKNCLFNSNVNVFTIIWFFLGIIYIVKRENYERHILPQKISAMHVLKNQGLVWLTRNVE